MKKTMYILGSISVFLLSTGLVCKFQHWPGASIMLVTGAALLNFGVLPMFLSGKSKQKVQ
jgi:hypothetical protein